jgi:hypothetical protein
MQMFDDMFTYLQETPNSVSFKRQQIMSVLDFALVDCQKDGALTFSHLC